MKKTLAFTFIFPLAYLLSFSRTIDYENKPEEIAEVFATANAYQYGIGVEKDLDMAYTLYRTIASLSAYDLRKDAFERLEKAAKEGITAAENQLAYFYTVDLEIDNEEAFKLHDVVEKKKYPTKVVSNAIFNLFNAHDDYEEIKKNFLTLKKFADLNDTSAEFNVARAAIRFKDIDIIKPYYKDIGKNLKNAYKKACKLYKNTSFSINVGNYMGSIYFFGITVPEDRAKAVAIWEKAYFESIETKNLYDYFCIERKLMFCYYYGLGVPKNEKKAFDIFSSSLVYRYKKYDKKTREERFKRFKLVVTNMKISSLKHLLR